MQLDTNMHTYLERDQDQTQDWPKSETTVTKKHQLLKLLSQQKKTQISTVVTSILILVFLLSVSVTCITLAAIYDNRDLYIVGGLFIFGLVFFRVMFTVMNCQPWIKNRKIHAMVDKHVEDMERRPSVSNEP